MVVLDANRFRRGAYSKQSCGFLRGAVAHAAAELSELQNRASSVSVLVPRRRFASSSDGCCHNLRELICIGADNLN